MEEELAAQAIACALEQKWSEAIRLNLELVRINMSDIPAHNRLAYAYLKSGDVITAKNTYQKVLKIDKHNPIALKIVKWLSGISKSDIHQNNHHVIPTPTVFLEEPGKTKVVTLVHTAQAKILCNLITAQKVNFIPKKHSIEIRDEMNLYIGALPDDLAYKLLKFVNAGNVYDVYIKGVGQNSVIVFIRELKRGKKYASIPSFTSASQLQNTSTKHTVLENEVNEEDEEKSKDKNTDETEE